MLVWRPRRTHLKPGSRNVHRLFCKQEFWHVATKLKNKFIVLIKASVSCAEGLEWHSFGCRRVHIHVNPLNEGQQLLGFPFLFNILFLSEMKPRHTADIRGVLLHSTGREGQDGTESLALKYPFRKGARALYCVWSYIIGNAPCFQVWLPVTAVFSAPQMFLQQPAAAQKPASVFSCRRVERTRAST